jgi:hypothetical protein
MGQAGIPKQMECLGSLRSIRFLIHLAKMVLSGSDYIVLWPSDFPSSLCKIIEDDAAGNIFGRGSSDILWWKPKF